MAAPSRTRRISVVGSSGSGKTRLASQLASRLGIPHHELDGLNHLAGWKQRPAGEFQAEVERAVAQPAWVIDGNYSQVVQEGPVWAHADTVVWVDLPRWVVMRQLAWRTVRRVIGREELWNGNREPLENLWSRDPNRSVIAWSWTNHSILAGRYEEAMTDPRWAHLRFVRLRSRREADRWLATLPDYG